VYAKCPCAPYVPHQCLTTMDLGSRAALPCAARSDSAEAISASRLSARNGTRQRLKPPAELDEPGAVGHTGAVPTVYKSSRRRIAVRQWCSDALARAGLPLTSATVDTSVGRVALVSAGRLEPRVVVVPGTGSNAAVALPWLRALSAALGDHGGSSGMPAGRRPVHPADTRRADAASLPDVICAATCRLRRGVARLARFLTRRAACDAPWHRVWGGSRSMCLR
jgi:hypothetical protein